MSNSPTSRSPEPFDKDEDTPRIILPTPGGRAAPKPATEQSSPQPVQTSPAGLPVEDILAGFDFGGSDMPILAAKAAPLLNLAHALRQRGTIEKLAELRREVVRAVKEYEATLGRAGILPDQARAAHYVVCATLDDVIRNIEGGSEWSVEGLVSTFHHDVTGGDKVFELLAHFQTAPGANRDLLLLIYLALSLGFEGRTRVRPRGALELAQVRESLFRTLRGQFGTVEHDLSPHWKGEMAKHEPLRAGVLFWLLSGTALLLLMGLFLVFTFLLNRTAEGTLARLATLPPGGAPSLMIPEPPAPPPPPEREPEPQVVPQSEPVPPGPPPIETFIGFLQPEVEEGLVRLYREEDAVLVRIANSGAFGVGGAAINPDFLDIFDRIGQALAAEDFDVTVLGHTDNQPIRSAPYPSNFHLSTARANAVRDIIVTYTGPERVDIRGTADESPIADNATPEGREINRRTEILVREVGDRVPPSLLTRGAFEPPLSQSDAEDQP